MRIQSFDNLQLIQHAQPRLTGLRHFAAEFWYFGIEPARACQFDGSFLTAVFALPHKGFAGVPRYDALQIVAPLLQVWLIWANYA